MYVNVMINMDNIEENGKSVCTRANWSADSKQLYYESTAKL